MKWKWENVCTWYCQYVILSSVSPAGSCNHWQLEFQRGVASVLPLAPGAAPCWNPTNISSHDLIVICRVLIIVITVINALLLSSPPRIASKAWMPLTDIDSSNTASCRRSISESLQHHHGAHLDHVYHLMRLLYGLSNEKMIRLKFKVERLKTPSKRWEFVCTVCPSYIQTNPFQPNSIN